MSLLLDARKKIELALMHGDSHTGSATQPAGELGMDDLQARNAPQNNRDEPFQATPRAAPARGAPEAPPSRDDARAANLFAAKAVPVRARGRLGIVPISIISGLVLAAGGGYYVWREISPPPMQRHVPPPAPAAPLASVAPPAAPLATPAKQTASATSVAPTISAAPAKSVPEKNRAAKNITAKHKHTPTEVSPKRSNLTPRIAAPSTPSIPPTPPAEAPHNTTAQPILIEHVQDKDAVDPTLLAAYQTYRNGDLDTARQRYSEVLRKDAQNHSTPNRDALLGMAAIAQQQSQDAIAARYYNQVLMLDPRDPVANAGMAALLGTIDAAATESRLKLLLTQQPRPTGSQSSTLHFALGNLYAEQSRWGEAQQAYFNAFKLEQNNAQFAFNLAVSLDHLGQGKLATQHYQRALQLDPSDNPGFNRAQTQQRINELTTP